MIETRKHRDIGNCLSGGSWKESLWRSFMNTNVINHENLIFLSTIWGSRQLLWS